MEKLLVIGALALFVFGFLIWSALMQKKALKSQQNAIEVQAEANEREKKMEAYMEEMVRLNREQLEVLNRINAGLGDVRKVLDGKSETSR
ncbi:hypothetical protein [Hydrogenimonas sp. SS33]|uniref:hypothetical protein n=1 Tax=Hydrogenimonas leucolamina TaxID=2954236 RepID=UPI00336BF9C0